MSGRMLVSGAMLGEFHHDHPAPEKHDHVVLDMEDGARITFNDARRFGAMDLSRRTRPRRTGCWPGSARAARERLSTRTISSRGCGAG
jgi:formamidopyrimidine-DNA glycosylase